MRRMTMPYWPARGTRLTSFDAATALLVAALLILAILTFRRYAISNDEEVQHRYGELIIAYYASGFLDETLFQFKNLYLYGGLFDIVAVLLAKVLPFETYAIRHVLSAFCGIGGIAATALTARLIAAPRAGTLAAAMLAVCGVWYGGMFNHTKDIPFAAAMMGTTYFLLRTARDLPAPRWRDISGFGLLFGVTLGLRAFGLLFVGYVVLAVIAQASLTERRWSDRGSFIGHALIRFLPALALAYAIMIAAWPWASLEFLNPVRAIFAFAHFQYPIRTMFAGQIYEMADVPRWYVAAYLAIKLPLFVLLGAAATIAVTAARVLAAPRRMSLRVHETTFIAFIALFPLICEMVVAGPAFTGMRHFLFVVPTLVVLAAIGADAALTWLASRRPLAAVAGYAVIGVALLWPATVLARLHPYEYLFYNSLVGGLEGAARRYEMDYWVNIMPEATGDLESYLARSGRVIGGSDRYSVAICGERIAFETLPHAGLYWTDGWREADFFVAPTQMNCDRALDGKTVATIERFGVPIGVVKDRRAITRPGITLNR
jgi:hypothetical protein